MNKKTFQYQPPACLWEGGRGGLAWGPCTVRSKFNMSGGLEGPCTGRVPGEGAGAPCKGKAGGSLHDEFMGNGHLALRL